MTQIRRPRQQQRVTLLRLFLGIAAIVFFSTWLFQLDAFPRKQQRSGLLTPIIASPGTLVAQDYVRKRLALDEPQPQGPVMNEAAVDSNDSHRRRFVMELSNLKQQEGEGQGEAQTARVIVETRPDWAPIGASHFVKLVQNHYFDGCRFFRVVPNFIVQFGIAASPDVHRQWKDDVLKDDPVLQTNQRGTVTFATSGPNTRTTQLFINTKTDGNAFLDKQGFAPFAEIVHGMEFVDQIVDEYREKPVQGKIVNRGNSYLEAEYPNLSCIVTVRELEEETAAEAAAAAALE